MGSIVVCLGGDGPERLMPHIADRVDLVDPVAVIAADSGLHLADTLELPVDLVVGDMDSVDASLLNKYEQRGTHIARFSHDKDETDFELALLAARNYSASKLTILGGGGQRLDHFLSVVAIASGPLTEKWTVDIHTQNEYIVLCRPTQPRELNGTMGEHISLIPIGGSAHGVTTSGFKWELADFVLDAHSGRGVSNQYYWPAGTC